VDIDRLFVQQIVKVLDGAMFHRYISNDSAGKRMQRRNPMNRFRLIAIGTMILFALSIVAQQAATQVDRPADGAAKNEHSQGGVNSGVPSVEDHLKMLSEKLALTADQQTKARPILQEMHDTAQKVMQNQKISDQERTSKLRACHLRADKKMREILNDDQKKKLDQLEQDAHMDLHGNVNGARPPLMRAPQI
jgi:hypothetical protein